MTHRDIEHPLAGGAERAIYEIARRMVKKGHAVFWYSVKWDHSSRVSEKSGIHIVRFNSNISAHLTLPILLRKSKIHIIIDDMGHAVPWLSEIFTGKPGTVNFWHLHRRSLPGQVSLFLRIFVSGLEALYPLFYRKWSFVTESDSSLKDLKNLGIKSNRIVKIPLAVDSEFFVVHKKYSNPTLIYFGGMRDYKRPWESVYVLHRLLPDFNNLRLIMVGNGPSLKKVREIVSGLNLSDHVVFTGQLSHSILKLFVAKSWVNIHSSITEGFGLSILEASACGTPTVAYRVPGVIDSVSDGVNGLLIENCDIDLMSLRIREILNTYPGNWIQSSREFAKKHSWDESSTLWESHLTSIFNSSK